MAKKTDWSGAENLGVGVLSGCLHEKLTNNIVSLINAAEQLVEYVEKTNPDAAELFRYTIARARKELLTQDEPA